MLWQILVQFLFRLAFGLSASMACTSSRSVTSGFFRVHLWVGLGLNTFAAALITLFDRGPTRPWAMSAAVVAGGLSYVGSVVWLYEKPHLGRILLVLVAVINLYGGLLTATPEGLGGLSLGDCADVVTAGLLLGTTVTAMLLGHWYLNTPTMQLAPLQRLVVMMAGAVALRAIVAGWGLSGLTPLAGLDPVSLTLLALRWLAGLAGILGLAAMTWQTLKIPNTQSATGILYVAVIFSFLGELTSQLLFVESPFSL